MWEFSQHCFWQIRSPGMWHDAAGLAVPDISKDSAPSIFKVIRPWTDYTSRWRLHSLSKCQQPFITQKLSHPRRFESSEIISQSRVIHFPGQCTVFQNVTYCSTSCFLTHCSSHCGDHSHCNGGLLGTIRNDTQGTPNNNRHFSNNNSSKGLSPQNSIRSNHDTPGYCPLPQVWQSLVTLLSNVTVFNIFLKTRRCQTYAIPICL